MQHVAYRLPRCTVCLEDNRLTVVGSLAISGNDFVGRNGDTTGIVHPNIR